MGVYKHDDLCSTLTGLLRSHKVSFEAISTLNNWLLLCCFPCWKQNLKPPRVFFPQNPFLLNDGLDWIGLDCNVKCCKTAQVETKPFLSCQDSPSLLKVLFLNSGHLTLHRELRGCMKFEVTLENWSQKNSHRVCVDLVTVREVFFLPLTPFKLLWAKASDANLYFNYKWGKGSLDWTRQWGWRPAVYHN